MAKQSPLTFTYPNSGILLQRKAEGKSPNYGGGILIADEVLDYIITRHKEKKPVVLDLAAWDKTSKAGNIFISVSIKKPFVADNKKDDEDIPF